MKTNFMNEKLKKQQTNSNQFCIEQKAFSSESVFILIKQFFNLLFILFLHKNRFLNQMSIPNTNTSMRTMRGGGQIRWEHTRIEPTQIVLTNITYTYHVRYSNQLLDALYSLFLLAINEKLLTLNEQVKFIEIIRRKRKRKTSRTPFCYLLVLIPQLWHKYQTQCEAIRQLWTHKKGQQNGTGTHLGQIDEAQKVEAGRDQELQRQCGDQKLPLLETMKI